MDDVSAELRRYLRYLRRYWWVLVGGAALGALGMFVLNRLTSESETSSTTETEIQSFVVASERWTGMSSTGAPGTRFAEDPDALSVAVARVWADESIAELRQQYDTVGYYDVAFEVEGRRVTIRVRAEPELAREVCEWFVQRIDESRLEQALFPIDLATQTMEARLDEVESRLASADDTEAAALNDEAVRLSSELALLSSAADAAPSRIASEIVRQLVESPAVEPSADDSDEFTASDALVGAASGFVVAAAAIIVWSVVDRRLITRRDVEGIIGQGSLLAVIPTPPTDSDLKAAAAAIEHMRPGHSALSLVQLGDSTEGVARSIAALTATPSLPLDDVLSSAEPMACIAVARSGAVKNAELERLQFVVERAGSAVAGVILVAGNQGRDLLD